ncbi:MAG TPA: hypothetical protein VGM56_04275 [Byssovorax sp.]
MDLIIDEIVLQGSEDWVYSPIVVRAVEGATGFSGESLLRATLEVVREILNRGLMEVGDEGPGFVPWRMTVPPSVARIEAKWRAAGLDAKQDFDCWFANTVAGNQRAQALRVM